MVDLRCSDGVYELDVRGYLCPFPVLKAEKSLRDLAIGDRLRVISTDSGSWDDFRHFALERDNILLERSREGDLYIFMLEKV